MNFIPFNTQKAKKNREKLKDEEKRQAHTSTEQQRRNEIKENINKIRDALKMNNKLSTAKVLHYGILFYFNIYCFYELNN